MHEGYFLEAFRLAVLQLFPNNQMKSFAWNLYLLKWESWDCRAIALGKKGQFRKDFFGIVDILEYTFLFEHLIIYLCCKGN